MTEDESKNIKLKNTSNSIAALDAASLIEMLEVAHELRKAMQGGDNKAQENMKDKMPMLLVLLEYLSLNSDNTNLDPIIFQFLEKILGHRLEKKKEKEDEELENEDNLSEEEKKRRLRLAIYAVYQVTNPNRIAGETEIDNFVKNVKTRGIEVARKFEGMDDEQYFSSKEIKNMSSYRDQIIDDLREKGGSRGAGL